jgi:predicted nucleic acid-binding protein
MKKKVYMDTTIASYYYDNRQETEFLIKTTRSWFRTQAGLYNIYISEATLVEAEAGEYPNKKKVVDFVNRWRMLRYDAMLGDIVEAYIKNHLMPKEYGGDALHLAYASYYKIDFLLTWNCNHLANANKKEHIRVINSKLGLFVPEITTPLALIKEDG